MSYYTQIPVSISCLVFWGIFGNVCVAQTKAQADNAGISEPEPAFTIVMESDRFKPSEISLESGRPVFFALRNDSFLVPHNFLVDDPDGRRVLSVNVSSGETRVIQFTPAVPGIYPFYCDKQLLFFPTHREQGMEGRFLVR